MKLFDALRTWLALRLLPAKYARALGFAIRAEMILDEQYQEVELMRLGKPLVDSNIRRVK